MTVSLYVGPVGSGKSYCALVQAVEKLSTRRGGVVANFPIKGFTRREIKRGADKRWFYVKDEDLSPALLVRLSVENGWYGREGSALLLVDEAPVKFNSRDWQRADRPAWIRYLAHTRKLGYDVIFVSQSKNMMDKQIRESCEFHVKHVNVKRYFWLKWLPLRVFLQVSYWQAGNFKGNVSTRIFKRSLARRYDTMAVFDTELQQMIAEVEAARLEASAKPIGADPPARRVYPVRRGRGTVRMRRVS